MPNICCSLPEPVYNFIIAYSSLDVCVCVCAKLSAPHYSEERNDRCLSHYTKRICSEDRGVSEDRPQHLLGRLMFHTQTKALGEDIVLVLLLLLLVLLLVLRAT